MLSFYFEFYLRVRFQDFGFFFKNKHNYEKYTGAQMQNLQKNSSPCGNLLKRV